MPTCSMDLLRPGEFFLLAFEEFGFSKMELSLKVTLFRLSNIQNICTICAHIYNKVFKKVAKGKVMEKESQTGKKPPLPQEFFQDVISLWYVIFNL